MPELTDLTRSGAFWCLPVIAISLMLRKVGFALGVVYGFGTCVTLYALLRSYVAFAVSGLVAPGSGIRRPGDTPAAKAQFMAMFFGKFIVLGGLVYLLLDILKGNIAGFLTGFAVSQVAMTAVGYKHLVRLSNAPSRD